MFKKASICALSILLVLSVYSAYQPLTRQSIANASSGNADQRYFMYGAGDTQDMNLYEDLVDQAISYGMNSFRVWFSWSSFQKADGTFDWTLMDAQLDYINNKNMPFALSLYFAMGPEGGLPEAERVRDASQLRYGYGQDGRGIRRSDFPVYRAVPDQQADLRLRFVRHVRRERNLGRRKRVNGRLFGGFEASFSSLVDGSIR